MGSAGSMRALGNAARAAPLIAALVPAALTGWLIQRYGVDVPVWDEWELGPPLFAKVSARQLTLGDLLATHNDHQVAVQRLLLLASAWLTRWNTKSLMWASWAMACGMAVAVHSLGRRTLPESGAARGSLLVLSNLVLFSSVQSENWLWGMQTQFLGVTLFVVASIVAAAIGRRASRVHPACILLAVAATFTSGQGVLAWLVAPLVLILPDPRRRISEERWWFLAWLGALALCLPRLLGAYARFDWHPPWQRPALAVHYFLAYLGGSLGYGTIVPVTTWSAILGAIGLALLAGVVAYAIAQREDRDLLERMRGWLALASYALGSAAVTMTRRWFMGAEQAVSSRYATCSEWLVIALLHLIPIVWTDARSKGSRVAWIAAPLAAVLSGVLLTTFTLSSVWGFRSGPEVEMNRRLSKARLLLIDHLPDEEIAASLLPAVEKARRGAAVLDQLGYVRPGLIKSDRIDALLGNEGGMPDPPGARGKLYGMQPLGQDQVLVHGWAAFTRWGRPADAVLLTYEGPQVAPTILGTAGLGLPPEGAGPMPDAPVARAWWRKVIPLSRLPPGAWSVRAWAFDTDSARAFPLEGVAIVQR